MFTLYQFSRTWFDSSRIYAIRCQILMLKCTQFDFRWGSAPDPLDGFKAPTSKGREAKMEGRDSIENVLQKYRFPNTHTHTHTPTARQRPRLHTKNKTRSSILAQGWVLPAGHARATFRESRPTSRCRNTTAASATKRMRFCTAPHCPVRYPPHTHKTQVTFDLDTE